MITQTSESAQIRAKSGQIRANSAGSTWGYQNLGKSGQICPDWGKLGRMGVDPGHILSAHMISSGLEQRVSPGSCIICSDKPSTLSGGSTKGIQTKASQKGEAQKMHPQQDPGKGFTRRDRQRIQKGIPFRCYQSQPFLNLLQSFTFRGSENSFLGVDLGMLCRRIVDA